MDHKLNDKKILNQLNSATFMKQVVGSSSKVGPPTNTLTSQKPVANQQTLLLGDADQHSKPVNKYSELFKNNSNMQ